MKATKPNPKTSKRKTAVVGKSGMPSQQVEAYLPLVHSIAAMVSGKGLPPNIDYNDLVSDGTIGLMKAWDRFDSNRGVKFETYASYRIRGEILDGLKHYNPVPYRIQVMVRDMAKKGYHAVSDKNKKGAGGDDENWLEKQNLSEADFKTAVTRIKKIVSASALMYLLSLEGISERVEVNAASERTPDDEAEFGDLRARLAESLDKLPEMYRKVLTMFFHEGHTQKTISEKLKLSRSKVNRVIARSVETLRSQLKHDGM